MCFGLCAVRVSAVVVVCVSVQVPFGLYAEQLSGTAFTAPRHTNQRTYV